MIVVRMTTGPVFQRASFSSVGGPVARLLFTHEVTGGRYALVITVLRGVSAGRGLQPGRDVAHVVLEDRQAGRIVLDLPAGRLGDE
jgi:hypothetical protein